MILLIDNYDSFSYNLYQMVGALVSDICVIRNQDKTVEEIEAMWPEAIILSPGPGRPEDAGVCMDVVSRLGECIPILGVCLGHQAICAAYGGRITYAKRLMHGKQSVIQAAPDSILFEGLPASFAAVRYHSLAAKQESLPEVLQVTGLSEDGEIMAVEHREYPVYGVQFHPESILTPEGERILGNFLKYIV